MISKWRRYGAMTRRCLTRDGPKSRHEVGEAQPAWFDAQMAYRLFFGLASLLDVFEDGLEHFAADKLVAWDHRTILDVIETSLRCIGKPLHRRTPDDAILVLYDGPEVVISNGGSKICPPRRLHETGIWPRFHEAIPRLPPVRCRGGR